MGTVLNATTKVVLVQFSFSNQNAVPRSVRRLRPETVSEAKKRMSLRHEPWGNELVKKVCILRFLEELKEDGYELADAFCQQRPDLNNPSGKGSCIVRFMFGRNGSLVVSDRFKETRNAVLVDLINMCEDAMWDVGTFSKDLSTGDGKMAGVILMMRKPFCCPDGQPVTVWQKDENGRRMGKEPVPILPEYYLHMLDGETIQFVKSR